MRASESKFKFVQKSPIAFEPEGLERRSLQFLKACSMANRSHNSLTARVTRLGEISPFGLLFKGPGEFLGTNMGCFLGILRV
jgi:hypothetical protein